MILNPVVYGSGGGDKPVLLVTVTGQTAISVTASKSGTNVSLAYDSTLGKWWAFLPSTGTWTVTASGDIGNTKSTTVSASSVTVYETSLQLSELPDGYIELEYLQSNGKSYFEDTYITVTPYFELNGRTFPATQVNDFISWLDGSTRYSGIGQGSMSSHTWFLVYSSTANYVDSTINMQDQFRSVSWMGGSFKVDGVQKGSATNGKYTINRTIIGTLRTDFNVAMALKYLKEYDPTSNTLLRHFVGVKRISDSSVMLFDKVRRELLENKGTDPWIAGPEV